MARILELFARADKKPRSRLTARLARLRATVAAKPWASLYRKDHRKLKSNSIPRRLIEKRKNNMKRTTAIMILKTFGSKSFSFSLSLIKSLRIGMFYPLLMQI